jgi:lipopolysaccharide export system protein LptA
MIHRKLKNNCLAYSIFLATSVIASTAHALPSDQQRPLFVSSEHWNYNYKTGESINTGNVVADRGTSHLTADKVITYRNQNDEITKLMAFGDPAHYSTVLDFNTPSLYTKGNTITYFPQQQYMILTGNASAQRGVDSVAAPKITYYVNQQRLLTEAPPPQISHIVIVNNPAPNPTNSQQQNAQQQENT